MKIDMDKAMAEAEAAVSGWDLVLSFGNRELATRCPTLAEMSQIQKMAEMNADKRRVACINLFVPQSQGAASTLDDEQLSAAAVAVVAAFAERVKKKSLRLGDTIVKAVREAGTP